MHCENLSSATFIRSSSPKDQESCEEESLAQPLNENWREKMMEDENDLKKRSGRHTLAFWGLIVLLFALTLANLALTMTIISVLRVGRGSEYLEIVPEDNSVKFNNVDLDRIQKRDGVIEGFLDRPMSIGGENGDVLFNLVFRNGHVHNRFYMGLNETHFRNVNHFDVRSPVTGELVFSTTKPTYNLKESPVNLRSSSVTASRITSAVDENLQVQTRGKLIISGAEGVTLNGKEQVWTADQNIHLRSINGSVALSAPKGGYYFDRIPVIQLENGIRSGELQFKLCVCLNGQLFRVAVPRGLHGSKITCTHFNVTAHFNPCEQ